MSDAVQAATLREALVSQYDEMKKVLTRRLGSEDLAGEALQETYLRLERPAQIGIIAAPKQYLLAIATNIARMRLRRERRSTSILDLDATLGIVDELPGPLQTLEARQQIEALQQAYDGLTPRRRQIVFSARVVGMRLADIAEQLGVSQRLVEKELKVALLQCGACLNRDVVQRFGPGASQTSKERGTPIAAPETYDDEAR
ncbi:RNA polymerase sigma factor [Rhodopseudomonas sp. P2A-2r]|uniref:RNA polymerase sigma factor n=1 Tax=unclassified Rhodopseudomonas TaxID=2638247 RepID=UPI00223460CC|nr:sigma-70 family RNA polymerase sigma factor [Rhodopseudomonas sp. P2A-2r]UZE50922.1 sigma-70 family RNA polymerase sigma factor [Rhodopseudomonas sp. P2A-2r]